MAAHFGVSRATIWKALQKERDPKERQAYCELIQQIPPEQVVYMDPSGVDYRDIDKYGWAPKGERV